MTCLYHRLPIFELFLGVGNLKPKLKWFFNPRLKQKCVQLNRPPELRDVVEFEQQLANVSQRLIRVRFCEIVSDLSERSGKCDNITLKISVVLYECVSLIDIKGNISITSVMTCCSHVPS